MNSGIADKAYYEKYYTSRDWTAYDSLIHQVKQYSKPGNVLDVGSGAGFFLEACQHAGIPAFGIEGSTEGIVAMKERNPSLEAHQQFLSGPFPFADGFFQTILINQVIEHLELEVQMNCLRESYRTMASGAAIIIHSPSIYNTREKNSDPTHINLLSPRQLSHMMKSVGFHSLIDLNSLPLYILGDGRLARRVINSIYYRLRPGFLSANASFVGYK